MCPAWSWETWAASDLQRTTPFGTTLLSQEGYELQKRLIGLTQSAGKHLKCFLEVFKV